MEEKNNNYGVKELESILIKATSNIEIGNRSYEKGETVLAFTKAFEARVYESNSIVMARGGIHNYPQVVWESPRDLSIEFVNGLLSDESFSFALRSGLINRNLEEDKVELSEYKVLPNVGATRQLKGVPNKIFVFIKGSNGWEKTNSYTIQEDKIVLNEDISMKDILVDYTYNFKSPFKEITIGQERFSFNFQIECKGKMKDKNTGKTQTVYFIIPKARLQGNFNIQLGEKVSPSVEVFRVIGMPISENGKKIVGKFFILEEKEENI